jgi:hypothetical protein
MNPTTTAWSSSLASRARPSSSSGEQVLDEEQLGERGRDLRDGQAGRVGERSDCAGRQREVHAVAELVDEREEVTEAPCQFRKTNPGTRVLGQRQKAALGLPRLGSASMR